MKDRFYFRTPIYDKDGKFKEFVHWNAYAGAPAVSCRESDVFKDPEQCTGLKDKNGVLIYEGDILKIVMISKNYKDLVLDEKAVVTFVNGAFGHQLHHIDFPLVNYANGVTFEIIGNIHENPELVEEK